MGIERGQRERAERTKRSLLSYVMVTDSFDWYTNVTTPRKRGKRTRTNLINK
jgi:hypothetical protein